MTRKAGDIALALEDIDSEAGIIQCGAATKVAEVSAAGHFLRLEGHSTGLRASRFRKAPGSQREICVMTDEQIDLLAQTMFAGFYSDIPAVHQTPWDEQSTLTRGNWRRAARAVARTLNGNRHWLDGAPA